jgi:nicotinamide riboside transporter PnuC
MDIVAGLLELTASWLVGNRNRKCFVFYICANLFWIYVALDKHIYGLLIICIPSIYINIRNSFKWKKEGV